MFPLPQSKYKHGCTALWWSFSCCILGFSSLCLAAHEILVSGHLVGFICFVSFWVFFACRTSVQCSSSTLLIRSHPTEQRCRPNSSWSPSEWFDRSDHSIKSFLSAFAEHLAGDPQPTNCNQFPKNDFYQCKRSTLLRVMTCMQDYIHN